MAFLFILIYGVSYVPLGWAILPEVYRNVSHSKDIALVTSVNWLCNFIIGIETPPMMSHSKFRTEEV